jgi:hypothetical protein
MPQCYARILGDCAGPIEDEHFVPQVLQRMLGPVLIEGMAWQGGRRTPMLPPGSYAHSRMLCRKHHDEMDGLDPNAAAYFGNLMLMAGGGLPGRGAIGKSTDVVPTIDGRALERWFLKFMCGAIATRSIDPARTVPDEWIAALFERVNWPDEWALHVETGTWRVSGTDAELHIEFHWAEEHLNGLVARLTRIVSIFGLKRPDRTDGLLRRPIMLGADVRRDHGGPALAGLGPKDHVRFQIRWPD